MKQFIRTRMWYNGIMAVWLRTTIALKEVSAGANTYVMGPFLGTLAERSRMLTNSIRR